MFPMDTRERRRKRTGATAGELRIFNPTRIGCDVRITLYFEDRAPIELPPQRLEPNSNQLLLVLPKMFPEILTDVGAWGARIAADVPLITDHILGAGISSRTPNDPRFRGGVADSLAEPRASNLWYFGDGIRLQYEDPDNAPYPFNELEWYHILNASPRDADVTMHSLYADGESETFTIRVPSERVKMFSNEEIARKNAPYGIKFTSTEPVVIQSERLIYGTRSIDEWGLHMHTARPGVAGPLAFSEDVR
jgi:hypothetical protein